MVTEIDTMVVISNHQHHCNGYRCLCVSLCVGQLRSQACIAASSFSFFNLDQLCWWQRPAQHKEVQASCPLFAHCRSHCWLLQQFPFEETNQHIQTKEWSS